MCSCEARDEVSILANTELQKCNQSGVTYTRGISICSVESNSFGLFTPGIMVVTLGLTFQALIYEGKINNFALKVGIMLEFLSINIVN
jgi:hypothetical protein